MKKKLSLLLALMMVLTLVPLSAFADSSSSTTDLSRSDYGKPFNFTVTLDAGEGSTISTEGSVTLNLGGSSLKFYTISGETKYYGQDFAVLAAKGDAEDDRYMTISGQAVLYGSTVGDQKLVASYPVVKNGVRSSKSYTATIAKFSNSYTFVQLMTEKKQIGRETRQVGAVVKVKNTSGQNLRYNFKASTNANVIGLQELQSGDISPNKPLNPASSGVVAIYDDGGKIIGYFTMPGTEKKATGNYQIELNNGEEKYYYVLLETGMGTKNYIGDINVEVTAYNDGGAQVDYTSIVVAEYVNENFTLTVDGPVQSVYADGVTLYTVNATLKAVGGYLPRYVDFTVDGAMVKVQTIGAGFNLDSETLKANFVDKFTTYYGTDLGYGLTTSSAIDMSRVTELNRQEVGTTQRFTFQVAPNMDKDGEVVLTAKGRGFEDLKATILKVQPIATLETKVTNIPSGESKVATADIVVKEAKAGLFKVGYKYSLTLDQKKAFKLFFDNKGELKAENGEAKVSLKDNVLTVDVKKASTGDKPLVLTLSGLSVVTDRSVPYDTYQVKLGMVAPRLAEKDLVGPDDFGKTIAKADYLDVTNVPIKTEGAPKTTVFVVGQKYYTENGEVRYMDVAPWIQNSRAMMPIAFVANALSVEYKWDAATRTATFTEGDRVVVLKAGSDEMKVNGAAEKMDGPAVIQGSRMFVSVAYVAKAFGLESGKDIVWNPDTKSVTLTK